MGSDSERGRRDHRGRLVLIQGPPIVLGVYLGFAMVGFWVLLGSTPDRAMAIGAIGGGALAGVAVHLEARWRAKRVGT